MSQNTVVTWSLQLQCLVAQGWVMVHLDQQGCTGVGHVPLPWSCSNQSWYLVFLVFGISDVYWEPGSQDSCTGVAVGAGAAGVRAAGAGAAGARAAGDAGAGVDRARAAGVRCSSAVFQPAPSVFPTQLRLSLPSTFYH